VQRLLAIVFVWFLTSSFVQAGEITDKEWNIIDNLVVTYFKGSNGMVNCTAFNEKNKPIGGGAAPALGGVARVQIDVPKKYVGKNLSVKCE